MSRKPQAPPGQSLVRQGRTAMAATSVDGDHVVHLDERTARFTRSNEEWIDAAKLGGVGLTLLAGVGLVGSFGGLLFAAPFAAASFVSVAWAMHTRADLAFDHDERIVCVFADDEPSRVVPYRDVDMRWVPNYEQLNVFLGNAKKSFYVRRAHGADVDAFVRAFYVARAKDIRAASPMALNHALDADTERAPGWMDKLLTPPSVAEQQRAHRELASDLGAAGNPGTPVAVPLALSTTEDAKQSK